MSEWIKILGGGLVVGILNILYLSYAQKKKNRIEMLEKQISCLYGPLNFYCSSNQKLCNIHDQLSLSLEERDISSESMDKTVSVMNKYAVEMRTNNHEMVSLLKSNLTYADARDWHVFEVLLVDYARAKIELNNGKIELHRFVYKELGSISYNRKEINEIIENRYFEKKKLLNKLQGLS